MGLMIRFTASEVEIAGLARFLERRARRVLPMDVAGSLSSLLWLPLVAARRDDLRPRRTNRAFVRLLRTSDDPLAWGIRLASDAAHPYRITTDEKTEILRVDPEASRLILFAVGAPLPEPEGVTLPVRRREGLIELRDWVEEDAPDAIPDTPTPKGVTFLPQTLTARDLVARCTRRLRRRGMLEGNRWHVPPGLPPDAED